MGRGRKPKERKGYFYEKEEQAVIDYINSTNNIEKNHIFNTILFPAFSKMIESIIRRYKLYVPDEDFDQTFNDTISYLMTKIMHYKPIIYEYEEIDSIPDGIIPVMVNEVDKKEIFKNATSGSPKYIIINSLDDIVPYELNEKKYRAFSYCQTICKNYLMFKGIQYVKGQQRNLPYESDSFENNYKYATEENNSYILAEKLIKKSSNEILKMIKSPKEYDLNDSELKVGYALVDLLNNWDKLVIENGSNKLQKNSVLYFLREETMMSTKLVRDNMKKFKTLYYLLKEKELE